MSGGKFCTPPLTFKKSSLECAGSQGLEVEKQVGTLKGEVVHYEAKLLLLRVSQRSWTLIPPGIWKGCPSCSKPKWPPGLARLGPGREATGGLKKAGSRWGFGSWGSVGRDEAKMRWSRGSQASRTLIPPGIWVVPSRGGGGGLQDFPNPSWTFICRKGIYIYTRLA